MLGAKGNEFVAKRDVYNFINGYTQFNIAGHTTVGAYTFRPARNTALFRITLSHISTK